VFCLILCFSCQAEDGIRGVAVTGVQTCALPIWTCPCERGEKRAPIPPTHNQPTMSGLQYIQNHLGFANPNYISTDKVNAQHMREHMSAWSDLQLKLHFEHGSAEPVNAYLCASHLGAYSRCMKEASEHLISAKLAMFATRVHEVQAPAVVKPMEESK